MTLVMEGVRVVEVGLYGLVPAAGAVLADWGAEVIKVEHPVHGDPMRGLAAWGIKPGTGGFTYLWEICNRGKRSIGVDLTVPEGREAVLRLVERSDVFLTSFLPSARRKLGIDVDDVTARNPTIVYARGTGHGPRGPDADKGGFDAAAYWYRAGIGAAATPPACLEPIGLPGPAFGDVQTGMHLAGGIAAALHHRQRTGRGVVVDVSLLAAGMWAMQANIVGADLIGADELPKQDRMSATNPLTNVYRTSDNRFVALVMLDSDRYWRPLCQAIGRRDLGDDDRFATARARAANSRACVEELDRIFITRSLEEWKAVLESQDGPWAVAQHAGEVVHDSQALANRYLQDVAYDDGRSLKMVPAPVQFDEGTEALQPAPEHAAHTEEVLLELGFDWDGIVALKEAGAVT